MKEGSVLLYAKATSGTSSTITDPSNRYSFHQNLLEHNTALDFQGLALIHLSRVTKYGREEQIQLKYFSIFLP